MYGVQKSDYLRDFCTNSYMSFVWSEPGLDLQGKIHRALQLNFACGIAGMGKNEIIRVIHFAERNISHFTFDFDCTMSLIAYSVTHMGRPHQNAHGNIRPLRYTALKYEKNPKKSVET